MSWSPAAVHYGEVPPPSHSSMAPLMEDMLCDARTRLTEAMLIGPGRAVLFYGKHSMGEGLTAEEARDAAFLLTGAGMWVGKLAYFATEPLTIQIGRWAIAEAITDHLVKASGPGHPCVNLPAQLPFQFDLPRDSPLKEAYMEAENAIDVRGTKGLHHFSSSHLPQIVGSRVTGVHYQWLPQ